MPVTLRSSTGKYKCCFWLKIDNVKLQSDSNWRRVVIGCWTPCCDWLQGTTWLRRRSPARARRRPSRSRSCSRSISRSRSVRRSCSRPPANSHSKFRRYNTNCLERQVFKPPSPSPEATRQILEIHCIHWCWPRKELYGQKFSHHEKKE